MVKLISCALALFQLSFFTYSTEKNFKGNNLIMYQSKENFVFATYVSDYKQVRKASELIKSIRCSAGKYSNCEIYIGLPDKPGFNFDLLKSENVKFVNT